LENCISRRLGFAPTNKTLTIEANCEVLKRDGACDRKSMSLVPSAS
jgi:Fur family transcriptional regulator, ferric uptake regulator